MVTNFYSTTLGKYFNFLQLANRIFGSHTLLFISSSAKRITNRILPFHTENKFIVILLILNVIAHIKLKGYNLKKATGQINKLRAFTSQWLKAFFRSLGIAVFSRSGFQEFRSGADLVAKYNIFFHCFSEGPSASTSVLLREILPCSEAWKYLLMRFSSSQVKYSFQLGDVTITPWNQKSYPQLQNLIIYD